MPEPFPALTDEIDHHAALAALSRVAEHADHQGRTHTATALRLAHELAELALVPAFVALDPDRPAGPTELDLDRLDGVAEETMRLAADVEYRVSPGALNDPPAPHLDAGR